jgi:hypothetical protein
MSKQVELRMEFVGGRCAEVELSINVNFDRKWRDRNILEDHQHYDNVLKQQYQLLELNLKHLDDA